MVVEKPFGRDLESSEVLAQALGALYPEEQLWRIDHYLVRQLAHFALAGCSLHAPL